MVSAGSQRANQIVGNQFDVKRYQTIIIHSMRTVRYRVMKRYWSYLLQLRRRYKNS